MKAFKVILTLIWLAFSLTATAHAAPTTPADPPCHMLSMKIPAHHPVHNSPSLMPCCSQPVLVAPVTSALLIMRNAEPLRLTPAAADPMIDLKTRLDPRPPKPV